MEKETKDEGCEMWEAQHPLPGVRLPYTWAVASDVGRERENNEDSYALEPEAGLFLVTDGMGGHRGGELASRIIAQDLPPAIETKLSTLKSRQPRTIRRFLKKHVAEQSRQLHLEGHSESGYVDMGATVALVLLLEQRLYAANLGDSRIYRYRNGRLWQISRDHSVVAELVENGHISPDEADTHEDAGIITRYVGMDERAHCSVHSFALQPGDRLLLCTDGLTDMLNESTLKKILRECPDSQLCCNTLVTLANQAGGHDNITVLIVDWQGS
ncbi:PP2C family protein-serine/threonine phosphatase [Planctomycetota bacterium]